MKSRNTGVFLFLAAVAAAPSRAAPIITTVTFQQGSAGYSGSFDRKIGPTASSEVDGSTIDTDATSYFIDGGASALNDSGATHGLLRFDSILGGTGIPAGAKIISATVDVVTGSTSNAQSGGAYNLYRSTTPFNSSSSWATDFGGDGLAGNVGEILGSFDGIGAAGNPASARADRAVQNWVSGGPNNGFGIRSDRTTDGWSPHTTGSATVVNRPKLTVNYTLDPLVDIIGYQNGVNSYAGSSDLRIDSLGTNIDGSTVAEVFMDGFDDAASSPDQAYLVRFDGLNLAQYAEIYRAELVLVSGFSSGAADSPGPYNIHQMLRDWTTSTTYAELDSDGNPALSTSVELVAGGVLAPSAVTTTGINDTEVVHLDVTSIVENWRNGQANYGFYIGTPAVAEGGTNNGWQVFTTGAADASFRPELRIIGIRVPEPSTCALILSSGLLLTAIRRTRLRS